jgi:hypothetical protein
LAFRLYDVDVEAASLGAMLEWCLARGADAMLFVVRIPSESAATARARELFGGRIRDEFMAFGWPGTKSLKQDNLVLEIDLDGDLARLVAETGPRIADWREHNRLPEDPCVFRRADCGPAGWPMLYSVTPEEVAWIVSDSPVDIEGASPSLDPPTRKFIFPGRSFCRTEEW